MPWSTGEDGPHELRTSEIDQLNMESVNIDQVNLGQVKDTRSI